MPDTEHSRLINSFLEWCNPMEATFEIIAEPESGLLILAFLIFLAMVVLLIRGLWMGFQELFSGTR